MEKVILRESMIKQISNSEKFSKISERSKELFFHLVCSAEFDEIIKIYMIFVPSRYAPDCLDCRSMNDNKDCIRGKVNGHEEFF
jgi:hypothetical protein